MNLLESQSWCFTGQFALLVAPVSQQPGVKPPMLPLAKKLVTGTWLRSNTAANLSLQVSVSTSFRRASFVIHLAVLGIWVSFVVSEVQPCAGSCCLWMPRLQIA